MSDHGDEEGTTADTVKSSEEKEAPVKSGVSKEIERLLSTSAALSRTRERLPQPLFWSLFHSQIRDIKKKKRLDRLLQDIFGDGS